MPLPVWRVPEGLRVDASGAWSVGGQPVAHPAGLLYLKSHLVVLEGGAFVDDGARRVPVLLEGPPLTVVSLHLDPLRGQVSVSLDDGRVEVVRDGALRMDEESGRFEYLARNGTTRAVLSRGAHQTLLQHAEEEAGEFFIRVGHGRLGLRT